MGNFCICAKTELCSEVRVFTKKEEIIRDDSQRESAIKRNLSKIQNDNQHTTNENSIMAEIKQYFNVDMKQFQVPAKKKEKDKKIKKMMSNKKAKKLKMAHTVINNQYELMLKRLLEQKTKERNGPKRRTTIRILENNKEILNLIQEVIKEKEGNNNNQINKNVQAKKRGSLLLNFKEKKKLQYRSTMILSGEQIADISNTLKNAMAGDNNSNTNALAVNNNKNSDETK